MSICLLKVCWCDTRPGRPRRVYVASPGGPVSSFTRPTLPGYRCHILGSLINVGGFAQKVVCALFASASPPDVRQGYALPLAPS